MGCQGRKGCQNCFGKGEGYRGRFVNVDQLHLPVRDTLESSLSRILTVPQQRSQLDSAAVSRNPTAPHNRIHRNEANVLFNDYHQWIPSSLLTSECSAFAISLSTRTGDYSTQPIDLNSQTHIRRYFLGGEQHFAILGPTWQSDTEHERSGHRLRHCVQFPTASCVVVRRSHFERGTGNV